VYEHYGLTEEEMKIVDGKDSHPYAIMSAYFWNTQSVMFYTLLLT
jgi:hypothetical protein